MDTLETAIAAANEWVGHARPIIRAMSAIEQVDDNLLAAAYERSKGMDSALVEARNYVNYAHKQLFAMLDGIRDSYICDGSRSCLLEMTADEIEAVDAFNDALSDGVITVDAAIRIVESEA